MSSPTREQVQTKIAALISDKTKNRQEYPTLIGTWLTSQGCTADEKEKILDDLGSYPNY